jgi:hypothetical protein
MSSELLAFIREHPRRIIDAIVRAICRLNPVVGEQLLDELEEAQEETAALEEGERQAWRQWIEAAWHAQGHVLSASGEPQRNDLKASQPSGDMPPD